MAEVRPLYEQIDEQSTCAILSPRLLWGAVLLLVHIYSALSDRYCRLPSSDSILAR